MFTSLKSKISRIKESIKKEGVLEKPKEIKAGKVEPSKKEKLKAALKGEIVLDNKKLDELFEEFEVALLEGDVAVMVAEKIISDLKQGLYGKKFKRTEDLDALMKALLKDSLREILEPKEKTLVEMAKEKKPFIIAFVGVNGTGKTTTIAKIAKYFMNYGLSSVIAAADTYRAGGIEQLEKHAKALDVRIIKHGRGADPAAVAFDAIRHAEAKGKDVVLIDTAGRAETNVNLMDEMRKIVRVSKPDLVLFIGDALTGNAAIEQAERFNGAVGIDGAILTKADADAKGGSAISISCVTKKPIFFLGTGQGYDDLVEFDAEWLIDEMIGG